MARRLTFRKQVDLCWQKQIRDKYLDEGTPPVPHLNLKKAIIRPVSRALAEQIIFKYEWLGTMSKTKYYYGIFFGNYCAGVTCVGLGASMAGTTHHMQFGIKQNELLTLARGACVHWAPNGANSKLVSWTCRLLSESKIGKLVWATSDTDAGEIGTIYQACGWIYVGLSKTVNDNEYISPQGRTYNKRNISTWAVKNKTTYSKMRDYLILNGWKSQASNQKHRYVQILDNSDKKLVLKIKQMSKPYPKRPKQAMAGTTGTAEGQHLPGRSMQPSPKGIVTNAKTKPIANVKETEHLKHQPD